MRLRTVLSGESLPILEALEGCNVKTDEDLCCTQAELVAIFQRCPPGSLTFSDLERVHARVIDHLAAPGITGRSLMGKAQGRSEWKQRPGWTTGFLGLDESLGWGGVGLVELSGDKGTMKTVTFSVDYRVRNEIVTLCASRLFF